MVALYISPEMDFISKNIYCRIRQTFIRRIYLGIFPRRAAKLFFYRYVMPVAYPDAHERQKGARDRHENDLLCRVHPLTDLYYHMVLLRQLERENRRGKYFPFQHLHVLSLRRRSLFSLSVSHSLFHAVQECIYTLIYIYVWMDMCV